MEMFQRSSLLSASPLWQHWACVIHAGVVKWLTSHLWLHPVQIQNANQSSKAERVYQQLQSLCCYVLPTCFDISLQASSWLVFFPTSKQWCKIPTGMKQDVHFGWWASCVEVKNQPEFQRPLVLCFCGNDSHGQRRYVCNHPSALFLLTDISGIPRGDSFVFSTNAPLTLRMNARN